MVAGRGRREARGGARNCSLVWSARLYGQFSLDKTLILQAGVTVQAIEVQAIEVQALSTEWSLNYSRTILYFNIQVE